MWDNRKKTTITNFFFFKYDQYIVNTIVKIISSHCITISVCMIKKMHFSEYLVNIVHE